MWATVKMSSGRGRARVKLDRPLRKPGQIAVAVVKENDEAVSREQKQGLLRIFNTYMT